MTENKTPLPQGQGLGEVLAKFRVLDAVALLFTCVCTYGMIESFLYNITLNYRFTLAYLLLFAVATAEIVGTQKRFRPAAVLPGVCCVALSVCFFLHADETLHPVLFLLLIPLSGIYCITLTGANVHTFGSAYIVLDILRCELLLPLAHLFDPLRALVEALKTRKSDMKEPKKHRLLAPIVIGLVVAVPVLLLVVSLLLDADAAFESVVGGVYHRLIQWFSSRFASLDFGNRFDFFALFFTILFAPYIFAVMFAFAHGVTTAENRDTSAKYRRLQKAPPAFFVTVLGALSVVYVVYLLTQTGYFFSAFSGRLPFGASISVTEYARRGFFEMVKIAGVNFVLISLSVGCCRRTDGRISRLVKALNVFLCAFTMLLCAISISKILLYIRSFGLTEKRLYVLAADVALVVIFAAMLFRFCVQRFPYMKVMLAAVFATATVLGLLGVNHTIAWYNTRGLQTERLKDYSAYDLAADCSDAALPYLQTLASQKGKHYKQAQNALDNLLDEQWYRLEDSFENLEQGRMVRYLNEQTKAANSFKVQLTFDIDTSLYGVLWAAQLNGQVVYSGGMQNADGSALTSPVAFDILRTDLPKDADLADFDLKLSVQTTPGDNGNIEPVSPEGISDMDWPILEHPTWGCTYDMTLGYDGEGGYGVWVEHR